MARRGRPEPEEENVEETESMEAAEAEEAAPAATEFVPEQAHKPKSDVYTLILILTFVAFLAGCVVAGREAWENYDVQFWVFTKHPPKGVEAASSAPSSTSAPAAAPAEGAPK
ncbi:MAG: hypothetical protein EHM91_08120 [Planctomycetota bacterium]|nr:MAG: hypothetical protein EHM91_08120 [Planctomycetota bacterium]